MVNSILSGILIEIFKKLPIRRFIKVITPNNKINVEDIEKIYGLIIKNSEHLRDPKQNNKYIYWPVTPTPCANLIHLISLMYLERLYENGLKIAILVFDHYYENMQDPKNIHVSREEVEKFISHLKIMGLNNIKYKLKKESFFYLETHNDTIKFMDIFYECMGNITYEDLLDIKKWYIQDKSKCIRLFKPFINMMFLGIMPYKIGYTFSGNDEQILWKKYQESSLNKHIITNFYLPELPGLNKNITEGKTNVLDKENNITVNDSLEIIIDKIKKDTDCLKSNGIIYVFLDLFFHTKDGKLEVKKNNNTSESFRDIASLVKVFESAKYKPDEISCEISAIANVIYSKFHGLQTSICQLDVDR